jgi:hypothetical protein
MNLTCLNTRSQRPKTKLLGIRDRADIDAELRLLAAVRWSIREHTGHCR